MIKTHHTLQELQTLSKDFYKTIEKELLITKALDSAILKSIGQEEKTFFETLKNSLEEIVTGTPSELEALMLVLQPQYNAFVNNKIADPALSNKDKKKIKSTTAYRVIDIMGYNRFVSHKKGELAYNHSYSLKLNVCPYCNTQYTFTVKHKSAKTRPHFDHFYAKSKYPYFSVSFFNLIPSCYVCNSSFKRDKVFRPNTHLHPFIEGAEDALVFRTKVNVVDYLLGKQGFSIQIEPAENADPDKIIRAKKNFEVFRIEDIYAFHREYAGQVIKKAYLYNNSHLNDLMSDFEIHPGHKLFSTKQELIEILFSNYYNHINHHKGILSKLTRDLMDELDVKI